MVGDYYRWGSFMGAPSFINWARPSKQAAKVVLWLHWYPFFDINDGPG